MFTWQRTPVRRNATRAAGCGARKGRRLGVETLEARQVMATTATGHMAVGMNLENIVDWSPAWTFTDAFQASRGWITHAVDTATGQMTWDVGQTNPVRVDANGNVTGLATFTTSAGRTMRQMAGTLMFRELQGAYPGGTYRAEWEGTGRVTFGMDARVTASGRTASGMNYADLAVTPGNGGIYLRIEETTAGDPVRNFHVWMPDWQGQSFAGQRWEPGVPFSPFHPLFRERLEPFGVIRFMQSQETNTSDIRTWADRRDARDIRQSSGIAGSASEPLANGMSLEYMVRLANDLDADPWFNMPHMADDTFVRNFATYVRDTLEPGRTAYVEWSNEIWNFAYGFEATQWVAAQTRLPENAGLTHWQIAGREAKRDMDIWSDVFAGQTNRIIRVAAGQAGNDWVTARIADAMAGSFDAIAIAPYFSPSGPQRAGYTAATTVEQVIADSRSAIDMSIQSVTTHQRLADTWAGRLGRDIRLLAYEGGHHLDGRNAPYQNVFYAASHDPRMGELYRDYLRRLDAAGLDLYVDFTFTGRGGPSQWGDFAKLNRMDQPLATSHRYSAVVAAADGSLWTATPQQPVQPAVVSVSVPDAAAAEAGTDRGVVRFTRSGGNLAAPLSLAYAVAGTATAGADYAALPGTVEIPAGQTSVDVTIRPVDDTAVEPVESVVLTVLAGTGYVVGTTSRGEVAITSDDRPPAPTLPTLSITNATVTEGHTGTREIVFTVTLSARQSTPVQVRWSTADGTARAGSDYTARSGKLVFAAGQTSRTIGVLVTGDRAVEADETFTVRLAATPGATLATGSATGTIVNDDQPPTTPSLTQNITYAVVGGRSLLMDAYRPAGNGPFPAVVLVHGGGFTGGSKGGSTGDLARSLAAAGYAVFDINYRLIGDLGPGATLDQAMTAAQQDLGRAVDHVVSLATTYGIDPNRVAVGGGSAGAITALLASYGPDRLRVQPRAVINLWGGMYGRESSLRAGDPPMLIVHGTADRTVPYSQAEALMAAARRVNVNATLVRVENGGHTLPLDLVVGGRTIRDSVREFLDRTLR
jgi:acetyl esterase/lipase